MAVPSSFASRVVASDSGIYDSTHGSAATIWVCMSFIERETQPSREIVAPRLPSPAKLWLMKREAEEERVK